MDGFLPEGVRSQWLGPPSEWVITTTRTEWQVIHDRFWGMVSALVEGEPGTYDDLPDWMTEVAAELLVDNTSN